jgi:hypothetical protein
MLQKTASRHAARDVLHHVTEADSSKYDRDIQRHIPALAFYLLG